MRKHNLRCVVVALSVAVIASVFGGMQMNVAAAEEVSMPATSTEQVASAIVKLDRSVGVAIQQKREEEIAAELAAQEQREAEEKAVAEAAEAARKAEEAKKAEEAAKKAAAAKASTATSSKTTSSSVSSNTSVGQAAVAAARACIGIPYGASRYGTTFDCSGLTQYAYKQAGVSICHASAGQYSSCTKISSSQLQAGDLIFWASNGTVNHVGIYSGGGMVIDASPSGVVERAIYNSSSQYIAGYGRPY